MPGPLPKNSEDRERRNPVTISDEVISAEVSDEIYGFDLPPHANIKWCKLTKEWWADLRVSPQAKLMLKTDWWALMEAAIIHNEIWRTRYAPFTGENKPLTPVNMATLLGELRQRMNAIGATWESRRKNRMVVKNAPQEAITEKEIQEQAAQVVNYFDQLKEAVADKQEK
jgi:hypothetical protein